MSRPKLEVNEVWILEEVMPYEGSTILGVFIDPVTAMKDCKGTWKKVTQDGETHYTTRQGEKMDPFFFLSLYPVRSK